VVPVVLLEMMLDRDRSKSARVMGAFMQMKKFDIETLKRAYEGETV
jgi:predicted 3-demethylubiquinone-9 3-methyltransferase (glyoxalase superfamily)